MSGNYKVGFGKPPKRSRWKKGQSGNPLGRPKGVKNMETVVREEAYSTIEIKEGGKKSKVTRIEALIKRTMAKGIQGDNKAASTALSLAEKYLPQADPEATYNEPLSDEELKILSNHSEFLEFIEGEVDD